MHRSGNSGCQVQRNGYLDLDKKSGKFEPDTDGYLRFYPSDDKLKQLNTWIGRELDLAYEARKERDNECVALAETYKPVVVTLKNDGGPSILPSPISRTPADQITASTVNRVTQQVPIVSCDAYFPGEFGVLLPIDADEMRDNGVPLESGASGPVATPVMVDAETLSWTFEHGLEFQNRERLEFPHQFHQVVHACVTGQSPVWWKTYAERSGRDVIAVDLPDYGPADLNNTSERRIAKDIVQRCVVPYYDITVPRIDIPPDDLDWLAEKNHDLECPDDLKRAWHRKELFLIPDESTCDTFAASCVVPADDDPKVRTDAKTKKSRPEPKPVCPSLDIWFYDYLFVADPDNPDSKPAVRKISMLGQYHYGMRQFMATFRNPYNHQRRIHVPFVQFLDGSSTVGITRPAQVLDTHITQAEVTSAFIANMPVYGYNPDATETAIHLAHRTEPIHMGEILPGMPDKDWGMARGGFQHYSLLPLKEWLAASTQDAARQSDYENGNRVVSHTSPQVVSSMLERGGQNQDLFLMLLEDGVRKVMRLYLETCAQYQPLGGNMPVRDPQTKALMTAPFIYPIGEMLDNFQLTLTAANPAAMRERDPNQMAQDTQFYQQHTMFVAQVVQAMRDPQATEADTDLLRQILAGENEHYMRIISRTRADPKTFDIMGAVAKIIEAKKAAMAKMAQAAQMQQMQGGLPDATGQAAVADGAAGGAPPPDSGAATGGPAGPGAQPAIPNVPPGTPS